MNSESEAEALDGHNARNRQLINVLVGKGATLDTPRVLDIFFSAPSELVGKAVAVGLQELGMTGVEVRPTVNPSGDWVVEGHLQASVEHMTSPSFTLLLVRHAADHDSDYDGWGTEL